MAGDPAIVGRSQELERLFAALSSAINGTGSTVLVSGDAGVGKTALVNVLGARAANLGCITAFGQAYDHTEAAPYSIWFDILASTAQSQRVDADTRRRLGTALSPGEEKSGQSGLFERIISTFQSISTRKPIVFVLEDLQWADRASVELFRMLARRVGNVPILLVGTYRASELLRRSPLYETLPHLVREAGAERVELRPLNRDEIVQFLQVRHGIVLHATNPVIDYLQAHTEGNPLFLDETIRLLVKTGTIYQDHGEWIASELGNVIVPPLVKQLIATRLSILSPATLAAIESAAVIGQVVPYDLWQASSEIPERTLATVIRDALDANIMRQSDDGENLLFSHAVVRDVVYDELVIPERRRLHRRVANLLIDTLGSDPDAVASHLLRANDDRAFDWIIQAGNRAQRAYALRMAADRFQSALRLRGTPSEPTTD